MDRPVDRQIQTQTLRHRYRHRHRGKQDTSNGKDGTHAASRRHRTLNPKLQTLKPKPSPPPHAAARQHRSAEACAKMWERGHVRCGKQSSTLYSLGTRERGTWPVVQTLKVLATSHHLYLSVACVKQICNHLEVRVCGVGDWGGGGGER